jgi:tetratricopeptide (TPR) repeat protein/TolB-like protein
MSRARTGHAAQPGDVLAGRFRIVQSLGAGAVGQTYEALDLELGQSVAVKLLHPDIAADPELRERFRREAKLARQVTHPNVCRVHDLFVDERHSAEAAVLVSMELLHGETLRERIEARGPLALPEALGVARQLAAGLDAAHAAGVLHRDFKSSNVLLVQTGALVRAVITDFGLARRVDTEGEDPSLTHSGIVIGSPAYMAPEQVRGEPLGAAADLYAFGVVLFEMITGELPFRADSAWQTALQRLQEDPLPPSRFVEGLDANWDRAVLAFLAREPADRPESASRFEHLLDPAHSLAPRGAAPGAPNPRRWLATVAAGAVLLLGVSWHFVRSRAGGTALSNADRSIAVLGFENLTSDPRFQYLERALCDLLPSELAAGGHLRVVPGESVALARGSLGLTEMRALSTETLRKLRQLTGADLVVTGAYLAAGDAASPTALQFDVTAQDSRTGEVVGRWKEEGGEEGALVQSIARLGNGIRRDLGAAALSESETNEIARVRPANAAVAKQLAVGLERLRVFDGPGAVASLEKAAAADPDNPRIRRALASAWSTLGLEQRAVQEAGRAVTLSSGLAERERWLIAAEYHGFTHDSAGQLALFSRLVALSPDDPDLNLGLASAQIADRRGQEALVTVARLRGLALSEDPRVDILEARAAGSLGDFERQRRLAVHAAAEGDRLGAPLLAARGRFLEATSLRRLGKLPYAAAAASQARLAAETAGDLALASVAEQELAAVRLLQGDLDNAATSFAAAVDFGRRAQSRRVVADALNGQAILHRRLGHLAQSERAFEDLRSTTRELGDRRREAIANNGLALVHAASGRLDDAARLLDRTLIDFEPQLDRSDRAVVLVNLAAVQAERGELARARQTAEQAGRLFLELGEVGGIAEAETVIARLELWANRRAEARAMLQTATGHAQEAAELSVLAQGWMTLARLDLGVGDSEPSVAAARRALAAAKGEALLEVEATALLARSLAAAGRTLDAAAVLSQAVGAGERSEGAMASAEIALASAVLAPTLATAISTLEKALREAQRGGLQARAFELRLELARRGEARSAALARFAAEAQSHGFLELAERARTAR